MAYLLSTFYALTAIAAYWIVKYVRTVRFQGPPSPSFIFGHTKQIMESRSSAELYDRWAQTYGSVYEIHGPLGTTRLVVCDPRALSHILALDSWKYSHPPLAQLQITSLTGPGNLLVALGDSHSRQRKILNPLFGPAALKTYASVMYDSAYKACVHGLGNGKINNVSFDIIGLAAFSTDFKSLDGEKSAVATALTAVGHAKPSPTAAKILLLVQAFPILLKLPLPRSTIVADLSNAMDAVVDRLTDAAQSGKIGNENLGSVLGVLLNAKDLSPAQIRIHAKSILLAGFATTSRPSQGRALVFFDHDPSYDDLTSSLALPYLDAVVREALRLHPILSESSRVALEDDILPLMKPIRNASGTLIDKVPIRKGTVLTTSLPSRIQRNRSGDVPASAQVYPGYHHTMIFSDGPRTCLGKGFALTEMKIVLSLLIRRFMFAPRDGVDTKYEKAMFLGPHPKVAGETGGRLPMRVGRAE
ncbi:cytochrome P450 [Mycena leptocephala]|nr:cytochrome P450 [Mycena leptocephala]